jgi:hypothetical protein
MLSGACRPLDECCPVTWRSVMPRVSARAVPAAMYMAARRPRGPGRPAVPRGGGVRQKC